MLPVSYLPLLVEQRVCGVENLDLPCLDSGYNLNLTLKDRAYLRPQGITVGDVNDPAPENIPVPGNTPLTQLEEENSWKYEGIIFPRRPNNLHNSNADFKSYTREEVMKMTKLELFLVLFPVDYLKEILVPKTNKLLKHPMDLG